MGVRTLSEYLLTYLWVGMECVAAVLLFDAFSQRKKRQIAHWISVAWFSFLDEMCIRDRPHTVPLERPISWQQMPPALQWPFSVAHREDYESN